jgi:hypothetical protein
MKNCDTSKYQCGDIIPSSCVPYTGKDLTILTDPNILACNANINDVIFLLDGTVKGILTDLDLTGLDPQGLSFIPATVKQNELDQILINTVQGTAAALTALTAQVNELNIGELDIQINLGCLAPAASACLIPPNTYPLIAVLNAMLAEICALKTAVGI